MPAVLAAIAASALAAPAGRAAPANEACLAAPNSKAPEGGRWYYRTDRATNRKCWYVVAPGSALRHAASPKSRTAASPVARPPAEPAAEPPPPQGYAKAATGDIGWWRTMTTRWPSQPQPADAAVNEAAASIPAPASAAAADPEPDEPAATKAQNAQDEMPLVWPVHTGTELTANESRPILSTTMFGHMLLLLAGALAIAAMICHVALTFSRARPARRDRAERRAVLRTGALAARGTSPVLVAAPAPNDEIDEVSAAPAPRDRTREIEETLQQLLQDWERRAAAARQQSRMAEPALGS